MSYSNKKLIRHMLPLFDFGGASAEIMSLKVPFNEHGVAQKARLVDVAVMVTEVINADVAPTFQVGTAADNDANALLTIDDRTADEACFNTDNDTDAILDEVIDSGTLVELNFTPGSGTAGGAVTGQGIPYLDMYVW